MPPRILLLDVESAPITAYIWGLWDPRVDTSQIIDTGRVMCWAAKWLGSSRLYFDSEYHSSREIMLRGIHELMSQADVLIHHNGLKYDVKVLNRDFIKYGLLPPSPSKQIDTLKVAKSVFRFESNKLDHLAKSLGLGNKVKHEGFQLWVDCMNGDKKAWKKMEKYNKHDVVLLERVYNKMLPWIPNHPNYGIYQADGQYHCPKCGSGDVQKRGFAYTSLQRYQRFQCNGCGAWSHDGKPLNTKKDREGVLRQASG